MRSVMAENVREADAHSPKRWASVMAENVREADAHSPKRWAAGPTPTSRR